MDFEITIAPGRRYVIAKPKRNLSKIIAHQVTKALSRVAEENNVDATLLDLRGRKSLSSTLEKYDFAYQDAQKLGMSRTGKHAVVVDALDKSLSFLETVMHNAGFNVKFFTDIKQAEAWLLSEKDG